ncbi:hypothetical protein EDC96DRAFT_508271 [Choanephora cucurbitarum]|nr:hypothetical protein EDC96DRAFT_508271 [Choanephora cucurbitarum]
MNISSSVYHFLFLGPWLSLLCLYKLSLLHLYKLLLLPTVSATIMPSYYYYIVLLQLYSLITYSYCVYINHFI